MRRLAQSWACGVKVTDFSAETLGAAYDSHQIKLISSRINRIAETAVETDEEYVSDGPGGQGTP
jgi:hypothetical protein